MALGQHEHDMTSQRGLNEKKKKEEAEWPERNQFENL